MIIVGASALGSGGDDFDLRWNSIDGGSGTGSGGGYELAGTCGQPDAGPAMTGRDFELVGGFWSMPAPSAPPCPADLDGSGEVGFSDLLAVLSAWGACDKCPEDLDGDGVVGFSDLLVVLSAWGPCP